ncbi:M28 family metallopeptidase [Cytophagaceae bacterium YF14B1]|uniref:M28 family metallopeptidase n=1 Tax=Xanthocytophaga flava TaxID=3048013 RepID=A0AAE3U7B8_9BACT|nr:M28 family metallopeptidase [Xanthocytophaga flavus]MDJ1479509.1 M28 family metallopeptidase [Xanthocytophaga flavus]
MKKIYLFCLLLGPVLSFAQSKSIYGYTPQSASAELKWEEQFDSYLKASNLDSWMKRLAGRPHHLGSAYGKANAEFMRDLFKSWGFDAEIETYQVLFPTPKIRVLEMTSPQKFKAKLSEPALKEDATSGQTSEQLPVYNCWSPDGEVTAELVFVNYGVPDDYEQLERLGIDVKGKIVIAKYGGSWRGIKPKVAQEHGAIGCIIYSDPKEDGYFQGDVYPKGPFRSAAGAQRGSVEDMPIYPGDPLTPGYGATPDAKRLDRSEAANLLKIPVLPISYGDAQPLLAALTGPVAPEKWRGALPITYHIGPGPAKVHLKLSFDWKLVPCYNVIAKLKGSEFPDQWVIRGNHHDAWVNGADDPISGMVAVLEEARAVGELVKAGWKPKRTLVYCAWDGEEPSLIGSTEWAEHHAAELQQKAVAYINSDGNGRGFLFAGGSHSLETLVSEIARDVTDPQTGISILERSKSLQLTHAATTKNKKELLAKKNLTIGALGSGSDYTPFIQHLGIPSLNLGFGGESESGDYHSIYDSYDMYKRFKDPKFAYGIALVKTGGRATLRLANADILPFDFKSFHKTLNTYLGEVTTLLETLRESTDVENQLISEKRYVYAADPTEKYIPPTAKSVVPYLNFASLQNAVAGLEKAASQYSDVQVASIKAGTNWTPLNPSLYRAEQKLLSDKGLPRRPWYKHTIYAPGFYTGYGVKTLPGVREAIEQRNWEEAQEQIEIAAKSIQAYTEAINAVSSQVNPAGVSGGK